ncbi:DoxX family protein [Streptomyces sp. NPDC097981]|uniref:DoxX family protein n=1 Tax=Streptomyces sp. NPDC097981 TaxID=3155428 RepID=UPI0033192111
MSTSDLAPARRASTGTTTAYNVGLLVLRPGVGLIMFISGTQKLFGWFGGGGIKVTGGYFAKAGYPASEAMAVIAGLTETLGGVGVILGLVTPLAAAGIFGVVINAMDVKWTGAILGPEGIEFEVLLAVAAASIALAGPGRYAVDHYIPVLRQHRLVYGVAALALATVLAAVVVLIRH